MVITGKMEIKMSDKMFSEGNKRWSGATLVGVALVLFGVIALISNYVSVDFNLDTSGNWWVWFMFFPAGWTLFNAWKISQKQGGFSPRAIGMVVGGLCILLTIPVFLFGLDWGRVWPIFFVAAGLGVLLNGLFNR
jgi:hypothetical protein